MIDQSNKILDRDILHLDNLPSPDQVNFTFPNENGGNTGENIDTNRLFNSIQETSLTKSQVSFNNPKS